MLEETDVYKAVLQNIPKELLQGNGTSTISQIKPYSYDCSVCGEYHEYHPVMNLGGYSLWRRNPCKCERIRQQEEEQRYILELTKKSLVSSSGIGNLRSMRLSGLKGKYMANALKLAEKFIETQSNWLVYSGGVGTGKTHLAAGIANELIDKCTPLKFLSYPKMLDDIRRSFDSESGYLSPLASILSSRIIVIDDLGAAKITEWVQDVTYQIIDHFYTTSKSVIITTNLRSPSDLARCIGERSADRILHKSIWCKLHGSSIRRRIFNIRNGGL